MKRLMFYVGMMLVTFAFGMGIHGLIGQGQSDNAPPPEIIVAPLQKDVAAPVAPVAPPLPAATPEPILVLDYDPEKFTPWAVFYIMGRKPKEFADFESLEVGLNGHVEAGEGYILVNISNPHDTWDQAVANFALVTERRLFFTTSQLGNSEFEYRFDGEFLRTNFNAVESKNIAVLRGTLTKTKNGRKIAEHTFNFRMEHLGC